MTALWRPFRHRVAQASLIRVLALASGIASSILIARLGGPAVKGLTSAFAASVILAFTVVNLDLAQQTLRAARDSQSLDWVRGRLVRLWTWYGAAALVIALVSLAVGRAAVAWIAFGTLAYLMSAHMGVAANGLAGPTATAMGGVLQQLGMAVAAIGFWAAGVLNEETAPAVVTLSFLCPLPLYLWATRPRSGQLPAPAEKEVLALVRAGLRWQYVRLAQLLLLRLDTLVVFYALGAHAAGIYSVGLATSGLAGLVPAQFAANATFEATQSRDPSLGRNALWAAVTGGAAAISLAIVGWPLLRLAYGTDFTDSYWVMMATLPGVVAYGVVQVFTNQMRIQGAPSTVAVPSLAGLVVMVFILGLLVPWLGAVGAGLASSAGACASVFVIYLRWRRPPSRDAMENRRRRGTWRSARRSSSSAAS